MSNYGFLRVGAAVPVVKLADVASNAEEICSLATQAEEQGVSILVYPELSLTGASCGDLVGQQILLDAVEQALSTIRSFTRGKLLTLIVGAPIRFEDHLYNCAVIIRNGEIKGLVPEILAGQGGNPEKARWFSSGADFLDSASAEVSIAGGVPAPIHPYQIFRIGEGAFAVSFGGDLKKVRNASSTLSQAGAQIIFQLSAEHEQMLKYAGLKKSLSVCSWQEKAAYIYCNAGHGESTQDYVFGGASLIYQYGEKVGEGRRFQMDSQLLVVDVDVEKLKSVRAKENTLSERGFPCGLLKQNLGAPASFEMETDFRGHLNPFPFIPSKEEGVEEEAVEMQVAGLASRLEHIGHPKVIVGVSGGLDSTLALLVCALAFDRLGWDRKDILGVTMPGFGTSGRTYHNALDFMSCLGISQKEISIVPAVTQHFEDIGQDILVHDVTYENSQARERTQILMDIANKEGGMVLGTGDLSELALGWATYNGDHMSMYGVNASIPKTLVRHLVRWIAENRFLDDQTGERSMADILMDVVDTPVSPELTPADEEGKIAQKTEDIVGPYELHDFFLYQYYQYGFGPEKIFFLATHAFDGKEGRPYYGKEVILQFLRKFYWRFFTQQFKRSCLPDGPDVTGVSLSPRGGYVMPSDAKVKLFIKELEKLG